MNGVSGVDRDPCPSCDGDECAECGFQLGVHDLDEQPEDEGL